MHLFIYLLAEPSSDHAALATHEIQLAKIMFISLAQYVCCFLLCLLSRVYAHIFLVVVEMGNFIFIQMHTYPDSRLFLVRAHWEACARTSVNKQQ